MATDSAAQVKAISQFFGFQGSASDLISQGAGPFFHYTDYNAFASIVAKSDLWLTDARFSNDAEELKHGRSLTASVVKKQIKRGPPKVRALARDVAAQLAGRSPRRRSAHADPSGRGPRP